MRRERWTIGVLEQSAESVVRDGLTGSVNWLAPPAGGFVADPFALARKDGGWEIYAEALRYADFHGRVVRVTADGFVPAVQAPVHLSYPQVFARGSGWVMFCESWEANGVAVFAAADPAGPWFPAARLLQGISAVDPTPLCWQGKWYLFHTRQDDGPNRKLRLMVADDPLGVWKPHPYGVLTDNLCGARPAGPLFRLADGTLIRSGQDCSATYGGGLCLFAIESLTPTHYRERLIRRIEPLQGAWGWGLHTLCPLGPNRCLIDGKHWVVAPLDFMRGLFRDLARRRRQATGLGDVRLEHDWDLRLNDIDHIR